MIVSEVMTTKLVTIAPDDTLSHAANLLRQYQFHHLPVVKVSKTVESFEPNHATQKTLLLEGLLTSQDIELASSSGKWSPSYFLQHPCSERHVSKLMHRPQIRASLRKGVPVRYH